MYFKIIFIVILVVLIIFLNKKVKESFTNTEAIENITKIYADTTNTATFNNINSTGTITGGNISTPGTITATGTISTNGTITGSNINTNGTITGGNINSTGTITGGNINSTGTITGGNINSTGTITGGNINTTGTITVNNTKVNNLKINSKIDISGNLDISGNTNINNNLYLAGTDIRTYLYGCSLVSMSSGQNDTQLHMKALSGAKLDLQIGYYSAGELGDSYFNDMADIIVVYPGFGVSAWEGSYSYNQSPGQSINIENYGTKPIKVDLADGTVMASSSLPTGVPNNINVLTTSELYNDDDTTYKITKSTGYKNLRNLISTINVYLLPMSDWNKHLVPS